MQQAKEITTVAIVATGEVTYNPLLKKPAAQITTASILEVFGETPRNSDTLSILKNGVELASKRIAALETGAVCAATVIKGRKLYIVNVGDCRIFLIRAGRIHQISVAHTFAETLIEKGYATSETFENAIYDAWTPYHLLGFDDLNEPDFRLRLSDDESDKQALGNQGMELKPNDKIVLCSSAVFWHWKTPKRWQLFQDTFLKLSENLQESVEEFINIAREQGTFHALTVVMLQVP